ncbi:twin-arginine translocase subunit TatC [Arenimonas oryziterrae]|uniref:Sec-independent protein translocase protein TatC n=1 Tax=Arenimonas oryziterrae DSM 21050 = YC6267 TaxID=1121015 RepID=A0A091AUC1_9GAMM|nr:twin-arginine translocase subunit TatC [Arenimonas oryziterrae]KFN43838.1 hypothetical protein N789_07785 [Arenimonas oryziterrae DSM 21050 = YC6267]
MSDPAERGEESLISHLLELRSRLLRALMAVMLVFLGLLPFADRLYTWLAAPMIQSLPKGDELVATGILSPFSVPLTLAFFTAIMLAMPFVLYQLWAFVAPGLYQHEKKLARPLLVSATALFYIGCAFTYYLLLPVMLNYLGTTAPEGVRRLPDISSYLDFAAVMFIAGGLSFEVPVAVLVTVILGWVTPAQLAEWRGYVIVAIFIIAAIITPPDGLSQVMLAVPMCLLYEVGILLARMLRRRADRAATQE